MAVRSERLALASAIIAAAASHTFYTVPAGRHTIIRSSLWFVSAAAAPVTLAEGTIVGGVSLRHRQNQLAQGESDAFEFWRVLEEGDSYRVANLSAISATVVVWLSGAELVV